MTILLDSGAVGTYRLPDFKGKVNMSDDDKLPSLESLDQKLKEAKAASQPEKKEEESVIGQSLSYAMRVSVELIAGVLVGAFIGYYLDKWLGTKPWLFILMFIIGAIAGVLNVYRFVTKNSAGNGDTQG